MSKVKPDGRMKVTVLGETEAISWKAKVEVDGFMRSTILARINQELEKVVAVGRWEMIAGQLHALRTLRDAFTEEGS